MKFLRKVSIVLVNQTWRSAGHLEIAHSIDIDDIDNEPEWPSVIDLTGTVHSAPEVVGCHAATDAFSKLIR